MFLRSFLAFCATCLLGAFLVVVSSGSCAAMVGYGYMNLFAGIGAIVITLGYGLLAFIIGIILFQTLRKRKGSFMTGKSQIRYFALLPLFVFPMQFTLIPVHLYHYRMDRALCAKSTGQPPFVRSSMLTKAEYDHLKDGLFLLPELPDDAERIDVHYYTDGFLPDFNLTVRMHGTEKDRELLQDTLWSVDTTAQQGARLVFVYHDFET